MKLLRGFFGCFFLILFYPITRLDQRGRIKRLCKDISVECHEFLNNDFPGILPIILMIEVSDAILFSYCKYLTK